MLGVRTVVGRVAGFFGGPEERVTPAPDPVDLIHTDAPVTTPDGGKPRVVILADRPGWAHDASALPVSQLLSDEFDVRVEYVHKRPNLARWSFDVIYVLFWGEDYHHKYVKDAKKVVKQVSSHRWEKRLTPARFAEEYLTDAGTVAVPSRRLQEVLSPHRRVLLAQKGFSPAVFSAVHSREGRLRIGWVGRLGDTSKGLRDVIRPAVGQGFELLIAGGDVDRAEMARFYNSIDIICVASTAEGDPLPLVEGMACGCFPVCVDVGIVPELVESGTNGLIVERTPAAFRAAFEWCAQNLNHIRAAGLRNAEDMLRTRTWETVSEQWRRVIRYAYRRATS